MNLKSLIPVGRQRNITRTDNPFVSLQNEVDRLFENFTAGFPSLGNGMPNVTLPNMDVSETDKEIEITAELPGLEDKDVQITVSDNVLTVRGEKKLKRNKRTEKLPPNRAQLWRVRTLARIARGRQCRCHQGQHRQGGAPGGGAEAGAGPVQENRSKVRRLIVRGRRETRSAAHVGRGARLCSPVGRNRRPYWHWPRGRRDAWDTDVMSAFGHKADNSVGPVFFRFWAIPDIALVQRIAQNVYLICISSADQLHRCV